jgi:3-phosphoshikimate 1-carboxyvinyltransferase
MLVQSNAMKRIVSPGRISGSLKIPGSKSHTIRALLIASAAQGRSIIQDPLDSSDTRAALSLCRSLGARVTEEQGRWIVEGTGGAMNQAHIDVGNSGTSLFLAAAVAAASDKAVSFDGDEQIRRRSAAPLLDALRGLGAEIIESGETGCAPFTVKGPLQGGKVSIACPTSQYLSALLLAAPLTPSGSSTEIEVSLLYERPYVEMTLKWLDDQGIEYQRRGLEWFLVPGGQHYKPFSAAVPADFSSATFFFCAAAITGDKLFLKGLDPTDIQGDKMVLPILEKMGCRVSPKDGGIEIQGPEEGLSGGTFDLNSIPDALPALAATACFAKGETQLTNVPQARIKETDRIAVMAQELTGIGAEIRELEDGLLISGRGPKGLSGGNVRGHGDHRVIMAEAIAALGAREEVIIDDDGAVAVTFPNFFSLLDSIRKV